MDWNFNCNCYNKKIINCSKSGQYIRFLLIISFILNINCNNALYGHYNWHVSSENADMQFKALANTPPLSREPHLLSKNNTNNTYPTILQPAPPIEIKFASTSMFSNEHLNGIRDAASMISLYLIRKGNSTIGITIDSSYNIHKDVPTGSTTLGEAYINENKIIFYPENLHGLDIFLVAVHEFLHILGFGTVEWETHLNSNNQNIIFNGSLVYKLAGTYPDVDKHSKSHWSGLTVLSSGKNNDIMEPYLHSNTKLSKESFAVIQQITQDQQSIACENTEDCRLLLGEYFNLETMFCHKYAQSLPGVCSDNTMCNTAFCASIYTDTHMQSNRVKNISKMCAFLAMSILITFRQTTMRQQDA